jgi:nucleoside-diphosphate-sugar epimerase
MAITSPVLITGASGFVGGHLAEALARTGAAVRLLVRDPKRIAYPVARNMRVAVGDVTDAASLRSALKGVRTVMHLAGVLKGLRYADYERVNVGGTRLLCEEMAQERSVRRLVLVSSLAAAGPSVRGRPLTERDPALPLSFYGITKRLGEEAARSYSRRFEVVVVRPGAVYGPRDRDMFEYLRMVRAGVVLLHGDGRQEMSFVHVADLVQALLAAAGRPRVAGRTFFVSDGSPGTWLDFLEAAGEAIGRRYAVLRVPIPVVWAVAAVADTAARLRGRPGILNLDKVKEARCEAWTCGIDAARHTLGYRPRFDLRAGVADTVAWCRSNGWL